MASPSSSRSDSVVSMQDIDVVQLKHEMQQLRFSETALTQECLEWKKKYQDEKAEVLRLSGSRSKEGRRTKSNEDRCSRLEEQLASSVDEVARLHDSLFKAQKHIRELELHTETNRDSSLQQTTSETALSVPSSDIECDASTVIDTGLIANIVININTTDRKNWTLIKRIQSATCKASQLDITGPQDLVADLVAEMKRLEADHAEQSAAAAHWQMVALKGLAEVDSLSANLQHRPHCGVPGHRNLADELEAKELQLQLQATLVAQWQKEMEAARTFFENTNAEMRESGMQGI
jgi:hypothetical protein